jgi:hypothetical protein
MLVTGTASAAVCSEIETNGVTFRFGSAYTCGQFISGDWWVVPSAQGEKVTITAMSPSAYSSGCSASGRNGWQVNPAVGRVQPFDDRMAGLTYDSALMPCLPYAAAPGESVLKTVSWNPTYPKTSWKDLGDSSTSTALDSAAILTILASPPPADAFRPPYVGTEKAIFTKGQVDLSSLPRLDPVANMPTMLKVRAMFNGPWLDHITGWPGRLIHPAKNMRNLHDTSNPADYGAEIGRATGQAILRVMHQESDAEKMEIVIPVVQYGIDLYYQLENGAYWRANGGHGHGRKLPILFTGRVLKHPGMLSIGARYTTLNQCGRVFSEDGLTFYGENGIALWGISDEICGCEGKYGGDPDYHAYRDNGCSYNPGWRNEYCRDPAGLVDGGTTYSCNFLKTPAWQIQNDTAQSSAYQHCCSSATWIGTQMATLLLDMKQEWNHGAFFDYVDRWMGPPWNGSGYYGSSYFKAMYNAYRSCTPDCPGQSPTPAPSPTSPPDPPILLED